MSVNELKNEIGFEDQVEHRELAPGVILYKEYRKVSDLRDIVGIFIWKVIFKL
jgi:hypothetical protein